MLICIGMTVFALQDTFIKLISSNTNIYLIYFVRCLVGMLVTIVYLKYNKIPIVYKTHYPLLTIARTICFFVGFSLYYFSLSKLSLPLAVTLIFVIPAGFVHVVPEVKTCSDCKPPPAAAHTGLAPVPFVVKT